MSENSSPRFAAGSGETSTVSSEAMISSSPVPLPSPPPITKKKRNQPGMPDPDAEVFALSPRTLLATNRFVCEICGKGFQRDQNLQLHRRGHNLPWKLRQRNPNSKEPIRKRVYVCPEPSCVHHDPRRALGDLTGIKKHFCRKHGEKKWKCDRCAKSYAVRSDWKAHSKVCGTKEYKCDCGTVFSRRDSFVKHRAFCDALVQECAKVAHPIAGTKREDDHEMFLEMDATTTPSKSNSLSPALSIQSSAGELRDTTPSLRQDADAAAVAVDATTTSATAFAPLSSLRRRQQQQHQPESEAASASRQQHQPSTTFSSNFIASPQPQPPRPPPSTSPSSSSLSSQIEPTSLSLSSSSSPFLYPFSPFFLHQDRTHPPADSPPYTTVTPPPQQPAMSATALLQKAASTSSFLSGFGLSTSATHRLIGNEGGGRSTGNNGLCLDLPLNGDFIASGPILNGHVEQQQHGGFFGSRPTTLDFLGLGVGPSRGGSGSPANGGLSALLTSFGEGLSDVSYSWDGHGRPVPGPDRKPNHNQPV